MNTTDGLALRAIQDVVERNDSLAVPMFTALLDSLTGRRLRNAIYLLGEAGGEEARLPIEEMLASDTLAVRLSAVQALGCIGNPLSLPRILPFAADSSERMRRLVAVSLAAMGDSSAAGVLEGLSQDWFLDVRTAALKALETLRAED
ncbi:MAG TPA: HEAT repeat domain-containing protein [Candidatus Fermentibacter sp.]|nr:HEAT repeat domain-containing protein [Candidatus Fermentibacter sp.]